MKFQVREGFVLQFITYQDDGNGGKMAVPVVRPGGSNVDLDEEQATATLHMLEPVDKAATAFCEARHVPVSTAAEPTAIDTQAIAAASAKATIDALVQAGLIKAPAA